MRGWKTWVHLTEVFALSPIIGAAGGAVIRWVQRVLLYGLATAVVGTFSYWLYLWEPSKGVKRGAHIRTVHSDRDRRLMLVGMTAGVLTIPLVLGIALTDGLLKVTFTVAAAVDVALGISIAIMLRTRLKKPPSTTRSGG
jgi:hypothetical protein